MPIFEYQCDDCGTKFEKLVRRAEANGISCPSCGEHHLTQQFSVFAKPGKATTPSEPIPRAMTPCPRAPAGCARRPIFAG